MKQDSARQPHRRYNPLRREWVLVSPQRTQRPWQGEVANTDNAPVLHHDPNCYLCPGNVRSQGQQNPQYLDVYAFDNDFPALLNEAAAAVRDEHPLLHREAERGICRVLCFHPDHSLTLARMQTAGIERVVEAWTAEYLQLGARPEINHVQIFENRGAMMGASNPHPHGQIWATQHVPDEPLREMESLLAYQKSHGSCLLCDYAKLEATQRERIICENNSFLAVVPFWAVWPFETLIGAREHFGAMPDMNAAQRKGLADILRQVTTRYDNLFQISFPYTMGFHQRPTDGQLHEEWHFHAHFYPPLLRSATVKKFMVGFEMLGNAQRDLLPEDAAARLRDLPAKHYLD